MEGKTKKEIILKKYKQGLIPDDLFPIINQDIEMYLEKKIKKNEYIIEEMISTRKNLGLQICFSEEYILNRLSFIF